jgi:uncharacterized protein (TIGR03067 family)
MRFRMLFAVAACAFLAADEPGNEAVKQEWKKLEGTWTMTKMEIEGRSLMEKLKPVPKITIKDGRVTSDAKDAPKDQEFDSSTIKLDLGQKPKTITIPNFLGGDPEKGVTLIGIYELKGDRLRVCVQDVETAKLKEREKERPKAFDGKQGVLVIFQRESADKQRLQGTWQVTSLELDGEKGPAEAIERLTYTFKGNALTIAPAEPGSNSEFSIALNASKKPKTVDLRITKGPGQGKTLLGIYEIKGNGLKICFGEKSRPAEFASKAKSGVALVVLKLKPAR